MWLGNSVCHADAPVVVEFRAPTSPEQRMWLRSTRVRVRRVAFHVDDQTSAVLLHDPTFMVGTRDALDESDITAQNGFLDWCVSALFLRGSLGHHRDKCLPPPDLSAREQGSDGTELVNICHVFDMRTWSGIQGMSIHQ